MGKKTAKRTKCSELFKQKKIQKMMMDEWNKQMPYIMNENNGVLPHHAFKYWKQDFKKGFMFGCKDIQKTNNINKTLKNVQKKFKK